MQQTLHVNIAFSSLCLLLLKACMAQEQGKHVVSVNDESIRMFDVDLQLCISLILQDFAFGAADFARHAP